MQKPKRNKTKYSKPGKCSTSSFIDPQNLQITQFHIQWRFYIGAGELPLQMLALPPNFSRKLKNQVSKATLLMANQTILELFAMN